MLPLGVIIRTSPFPGAYIYPQDIIVGLIFIITFITFIREKRNEYKKIFVAIAIFNIVSVISLAINSYSLSANQLIVSGSYLLRFDVYSSVLFFGIFNLSALRTAFLKRLFMFSSAVFVLFGFIQYSFYNNLRNLYYLGWDEHLYRLFSTLLDPNYAGVLLVLMSMMFLGDLCREKKVLSRSSMIIIFLLLFTLIAVLLTHSRTALLALVSAGGFFFIITKKFKILIISFLILTSGILYVSDFSVEGLNPVRVASSEARIESTNEAIEIFMDSPIYGIGFNAYRYAQQNKGFRSASPTILSNADAGTDNSFLFVLATTGIIGLASFVNIWIQIVNKVRNNKFFYERIITLSMIMALFIGSFFINAIFYIPILLWLYLYIGMRIRNV